MKHDGTDWVCAECNKPFITECDCPASVTYTQERTTMSFEDQLARILPHVDDQHQFLAGVRFVQGFKEHGDGLMRMTDAQLDMARLEEYADAVVYAAEQRARKIKRHESDLQKAYASKAFPVKP